MNLSDKTYYFQEGDLYIIITASSEEEASAKYYLKNKLEIEKEISKKFEWDFSLNVNDLLLWYKTMKEFQKSFLSPVISIPESDQYKELKYELYRILLDSEQSEKKLSCKVNQYLCECNSFVNIFQNKYLYWLSDQRDKQQAFRVADKIVLFYQQLLKEEQKNSFEKGRVYYYDFLFQFCRYYCFLEGDNVIDYAVYTWGYEKLRDKIKYKDFLDIYLHKTKRISKRIPENISSNKKQKKNFEDFIINKNRSEEIFEKLNKALEEKVFVFVSLLYDYSNKEQLIDIKKGELKLFFNSFALKKGICPCTYEAIRKVWSEINKEKC